MTPTTETLPPLTAFLAWLVPQPHNRIVGTRVDCGDCALSRWLQTIFGVPVRVDEETIEVDYAPTGLCVYETPDEYRRLIWGLDYCTYQRGTCPGVTVEEARAVVRDILREEEG